MTQHNSPLTSKQMHDWHRRAAAIVSSVSLLRSAVDEYILRPSQSAWLKLDNAAANHRETMTLESNTFQEQEKVDNTETNIKTVSEPSTFQPESLKLVKHIANVAETLLKQRNISEYEYNDLIASSINVRYFTKRETLREVESAAIKFVPTDSRTTSPPTIELVQKPPSPVFSTESSGASGSDNVYEKEPVDRSQCPVCHGATCVKWTDDVILPGCVAYSNFV